jgi:hypothetical protein
MNPLNVREPTTTYIYDDLGRLSRGLMMKRVELDFLERHLASTIIKADLKLVKDTGASQKVETDPKTLRKTDGSNHFPCTDLNRERA